MILSNEQSFVLCALLVRRIQMVSGALNTMCDAFFSCSTTFELLLADILIHSNGCEFTLSVFFSQPLIQPKMEGTSV